MASSVCRQSRAIAWTAARAAMRLRPAAVAIVAVPLAFRSPAASPVHPTDGPALHRRRSTRLPGALAASRAAFRPRAFQALHGVDVIFFRHPAPRAETLPTIAWPPSWTWTCSTVIFCSPPVRYRFSASIWAAKVRASLLKARSALSCCGWSRHALGGGRTSSSRGVPLPSGLRAGLRSDREARCR